MNKIALPGHNVIAAGFGDLGKEIAHGDLVVLHRERRMTYEATIKRVKLSAERKVGIMVRINR